MAPCILVVDDNDINLKLVSKVLELGGYRVITARNAKAAFQIVQESVPDLAILDVMMPDMDGYELCRTLRQPPINAKFPIIMLTAMSDEVEHSLAMQAGADDLWSKPFDMDQMQSRLEALLTKK